MRCKSSCGFVMCVVAVCLSTASARPSSLSNELGKVLILEYPLIQSEEIRPLRADHCEFPADGSRGGDFVSDGRGDTAAIPSAFASVFDRARFSGLRLSMH